MFAFKPDRTKPHSAKLKLCVTACCCAIPCARPSLCYKLSFACMPGCKLPLFVYTATGKPQLFGYTVDSEPPLACKPASAGIPLFSYTPNCAKA